MKLKDFFAKLKEQGKLTNAEYDTFLSGLPDWDMPDAIFSEFENNFLTPERAAADPRINRTLRGQILDPVDRHMESIVRVLNEIDPSLVSEINSHTKITQSGSKQKDTYKMLEALQTGLPGFVEKLKTKTGGADEDSKQKISNLEKTLSEMTKKFQDAENEYKTKEKHLQSDYEGKLGNYKLDSHLEKLIGKYTFADHLSEARPGLTKLIMSDLKSKNVLKFVENPNGDAEIPVYEIGDDGIQKPKFNGNSAVTIQSLLDEATKPYIKVNNADGGNVKGQDSKITTHQVPPNNPDRRVPKSTVLG